MLSCENKTKIITWNANQNETNRSDSNQTITEQFGGQLHECTANDKCYKTIKEPKRVQSNVKMRKPKIKRMASNDV